MALWASRGHVIVDNLVGAGLARADRVDFDTRVRVMWRATDVIDALALEIFGQIGRDVGRTVIAE